MTDRTWTLPEPRERLTRKQYAALFLRQDGKCGNCGQRLVLKGGLPVCVDEHINPLWLGGSNDLNNRELWCNPCTKPKTAREATERADDYRKRDKHIGAFVKSGRPLAGTKASGWKKPMSGGAHRR